MESWDTRMKGWHHMGRPGPGLVVSSIAQVIHVGEKRQRPTEGDDTSCMAGRAEPRVAGMITLPGRVPPDPWQHPPQGRTKGEIKQEDQSADNRKKSQAFVKLWLVLKEMSFSSLGTNELQCEWQWWITRQPAGHVAHSKQLDETQTEGTWQILQEIQSRIGHILCGSGIQSCLSKVLGFPSHQWRMASIHPKASHPAQTCNSERREEGSKISLHAEM